jgi:hypothetical protein
MLNQINTIHLMCRFTKHGCQIIHVGLYYGIWSIMGLDRLSRVWASRHSSLLSRQANDAIIVGFDFQEYRATQLCSAIAH